MITPEFEKEFRELCEKHNVLAAFVTIDYYQSSGARRGDVYLGGHKSTCQDIGAALRLAHEVVQREVIGEQKNATKH